MAYKLLIIQDGHRIPENISESLINEGYEVITAENGDAAIESAMKNDPDLVICNVLLPEIDDFGVFYGFSNEEKLANTPFIFLTAKDMEEELDAKINVNDYLVRSYDLDELLTAVKFLLGKRAFLTSSHNSDFAGFKSLIEEAKPIGNLESILENAETIRVVKKEFVFREGEHPRYIFYLKKGGVKITHLGEHGKELIAKVVDESEFFGLTNAINTTPYKQSAVALEDSELMVIPIKDLNALLSSNIDIANKFIKIFAGEIEHDEEILMESIYGTVRSRVATGLLRLAEIYEEKIDEGLPLSREELAQFIGIAPETLMRTIKEFIDDGLVQKNKTRIIPDVRKLEEIRE